MKVLVVEDELKMASLLLRGFRNNGHAADVTRTLRLSAASCPAFLRGGGASRHFIGRHVLDVSRDAP